MYSPSRGLVWASNFFLWFFVFCFMTGLVLMLLAKIYNMRKYRKLIIILARICDWSLIVNVILWTIRGSVCFFN